MTPRDFCVASLAALRASEGRSRKRKRDQTPDAIGLALKRSLLEAAIVDAPEAPAFEAWLQRHAANPMTRSILEEWQLARSVPAFAAWLASGAPSDDALSSNGGH